MRFEIGKTFGGYEFIDFLGSSGTDATYKVRNAFAQRIELVRVLPKQDDPDLMPVSSRDKGTRAAGPSQYRLFLCLSMMPGRLKGN